MCIVNRAFYESTLSYTQRRRRLCRFHIGTNSNVVTRHSRTVRVLYLPNRRVFLDKVRQKVEKFKQKIL
jgi:hypothetical protein